MAAKADVSGERYRLFSQGNLECPRGASRHYGGRYRCS